MTIANISNVLPAFFMLLWLGFIIFSISLAVRLVRAVEEIASKSGLATRILEVMVEKVETPPET